MHLYLNEDSINEYSYGFGSGSYQRTVPENSTATFDTLQFGVLNASELPDGLSFDITPSDDGSSFRLQNRDLSSVS